MTGNEALDLHQMYSRLGRLLTKVSVQVSKSASVQLCDCASVQMVQVCNLISVQVCLVIKLCAEDA